MTWEEWADRRRKRLKYFYRSFVLILTFIHIVIGHPGHRELSVPEDHGWSN
jgi:hypothetical protein